jgi:hypothetical protein
VRQGEADFHLFLLFNIFTPYETKVAFLPHPASPASPNFYLYASVVINIKNHLILSNIL